MRGRRKNKPTNEARDVTHGNKVTSSHQVKRALEEAAALEAQYDQMVNDKAGHENKLAEAKLDMAISKLANLGDG